MSFKRVGCLNHPAIQALDIAGSMDAFAAATPAGWCWAHARPLSTHQDRDGFADRACRVRPPDEAAIHARDGATPITQYGPEEFYAGCYPRSNHRSLTSRRVAPSRQPVKVGTQKSAQARRFEVKCIRYLD